MAKTQKKNVNKNLYEIFVDIFFLRLPMKNMLKYRV